MGIVNKVIPKYNNEFFKQTPNVGRVCLENHPEKLDRENVVLKVNVSYS